MSITYGVQPATSTQALDSGAVDRAMLADAEPPVVVSLPPPEVRSMSATSHRWYVASIRPRFERKAADRLEAIGFGTFLPLATVAFTKRRFRFGRWHEETRKREVIAFPTYLFVCLDIDDQRWRMVTQDRDVRMLFGSDPERPRAVPEAHMVALFTAAQDRAMSEKSVQDLVEIGVIYRITDGPLAGHEGPCTSADHASLHLGLTMFGRPTPVRLTVGQVEKVEG